MKRTLCIILALIFCLSLTACGKKDKEKTPEIDLKYYATFGQIPEIPYKLGTDPETLKSDLSKSDEDKEDEDQEKSETQENIPFQVTEGETTVRIDNGEYIFCYLKEKADKGISYMVDLSTAYGFEQGAVISQVKAKLDPYPYTEREPKEDELFVLFGDAERTVLEYAFAKRTILFVFEENALVATILYDNGLWTE